MLRGANFHTITFEFGSLGILIIVIFSDIFACSHDQPVVCGGGSWSNHLRPPLNPNHWHLSHMPWLLSGFLPAETKPFKNHNLLQNNDKSLFVHHFCVLLHLLALFTFPLILISCFLPFLFSLLFKFVAVFLSCFSFYSHFLLSFFPVLNTYFFEYFISFSLSP